MRGIGDGSFGILWVDIKLLEFKHFCINCTKNSAVRALICQRGKGKMSCGTRALSVTSLEQVCSLLLCFWNGVRIFVFFDCLGHIAYVWLAVLRDALQDVLDMIKSGDSSTQLLTLALMHNGMSACILF